MGDDELGAVIDAAVRDDDEPETLTPPPRVLPQRGVCRVCGSPADSDRGTYCAEHKPAAGRPRDPAPNPAASAPRPPGRPSQLETELRSQLELAAMFWSLRDPHCAGALHAQAGAIAHYWAEQAKTSARVRRMLESTARGHGLVGAITVHLPLVMAIAQHHVIPAVMARRDAGADPDAVDVDAAEHATPMPDANGATAPAQTARPWDLAGTPEDVVNMPEAAAGGSTFV